MKNTRTKKMVSFAIDPELLKDMEAWIAVQSVPPTKTAVIEMGIRNLIKGDSNG